MTDIRRAARYSRMKWGDFLIAGLIAVLAVSLALAVPGAGAQPTAAAVLTQDGTALRQWSADELALGGEMELSANGYNYRIAWENGQIRFLTADCPDQVCVHTGWIKSNGQIAACAPGRLILKMTGNAAGQTTAISEVDVIVK